LEPLRQACHDAALWRCVFPQHMVVGRGASFKNWRQNALTERGKLAW
jgi:hypothetical protein